MITFLDEKITLNDGSAIPGFGFGCYKAFGQELIKAVQCALDVGYRYIDSAAYYNNEPDVGAALEASGIPRERLYVLSKLWPLHFDAPEKHLEQTLRDLRLEYVDGYLLHWPGTSREKRLNAYEALLRLKARGKIRSLGVSNFLGEHLEEIHDAFGAFPSINQIEVHPFYQQKALCEFCMARGVQVVSWGPLGRAASLAHPIITGLAQKHARTPAQIVLRWHVEKGYVPIPKSVHESRIGENSDVFGFRLSVEDMRSLEGLDGQGVHIGKDPRVYGGE